mgnify:CR=1 FL=1
MLLEETYLGHMTKWGSWRSTLKKLTKLEEYNNSMQSAFAQHSQAEEQGSLEHRVTVVGRFLPPIENIWASAFGKSVKSAQITLALGSGPNRCPMRPDSQFLEAYHLRHPNPHASVNAATLGHSRVRIFNVVEISGPARVRDKFGETNSLNI